MNTLTLSLVPFLMLGFVSVALMMALPSGY